MKKFNESELIISKVTKDGDVEMKDEVLPTGIIDAWKINKAYKLLLVEMGIQQFDNESSLVMIQELIEKHKNNDMEEQYLL